MESNGDGHHSCEEDEEAPPVFGICQLKRLFQEQQQFLDYFFKHLNFDEVYDLNFFNLSLIIMCDNNLSLSTMCNDNLSHRNMYDDNLSLSNFFKHLNYDDMS